jgi:hypothetical protein
MGPPACSTSSRQIAGQDIASLALRIDELFIEFQQNFLLTPDNSGCA